MMNCGPPMNKKWLYWTAIVMCVAIVIESVIDCASTGSLGSLTVGILASAPGLRCIELMLGVTGRARLYLRIDSIVVILFPSLILALRSSKPVVAWVLAAIGLALTGWTAREESTFI